MPPKARTGDALVAYFWSKVEKTEGCWLWRGGLNDKGYGIFIVERRGVRAHRFAFEAATGTNPGDLLVCHTCDNPRCVNPAHLFLGTNQENLQDMSRKGRARPHVAPGEKNRQARLTSEQVAEIRAALHEGEKPSALARRYGVTDSTVSKIKKGATWHA